MITTHLSGVLLSHPVGALQRARSAEFCRTITRQNSAWSDATAPLDRNLAVAVRGVIALHSTQKPGITGGHRFGSSPGTGPR